MYKIIDIFWERANVHLIFDKEIAENIYLIRKSQTIKLESLGNEVIINVTNVSNGGMLEPATWRVLTEYESTVLDNSLIDKLADKSRNFLYRKNKYAYLVNFSINSDCELNIVTRYMIENKKPQKFYRLFEAHTLKGKISIIAKRAAVWGFNLFYKLVRLFHTKSKNILFLTENDNELKGSLKALYEYIKNDGYNIRVFADDKFAGKKKKTVFIRETLLIAKSDMIFIDNYTPLLTHLRLAEDVRLIQLWHAGVGFKSVGYARFGITGSPHPFKSCHRNYTDVVVDNERLIDVYREVFGVKKEIFKSCGMPKLDGYLSKERIENTTSELYKMNPLLKEFKVILFSPTFRGVGNKGAYYDYSQLDLEAMYDFCEKNNFIFVIKMHPFVKKKIEIAPEYESRIFDYSEAEINDLIYVSDIMITDYSSCAYEFSLFDRPLIFFRYDKEKYEYERPMHTLDVFTDKQYEVRTFPEMMEILEGLKNKLPENRFEDFKYLSNESACEKIKKEIIGD